MVDDRCPTIDIGNELFLNSIQSIGQRSNIDHPTSIIVLNYYLQPMRSLPAIILFFLIAGCSKDQGGSNDKQPPVVTIATPAANQQFTAGQTIGITGTVTDNEKIAELHVHISNVETGALLIDIHRYPATSNYALSESFQSQAGIQYKIQVIAKDNSANEGRSSVEISTN